MADQIDTTPSGNDDTDPDASKDVATPDPILKSDGTDKADDKPGDKTTPDDPDKKADSDKEPGDKDDKTDDKKAEGAPEKYEPFKIEGAEMTADAQAAVEKLARDFNMPQDKALTLAQAYFDFNSKQIEDAKVAQDEAIKQHAIDQVDTLKKEWGPEFDKNSAIASKAFNQYFDADGQKYIAANGFAHDAVIAKAFLNIGKRISEDSVEDGTAATGDETFNSLTEIFPQPPVANATDG